MSDTMTVSSGSSIIDFLKNGDGSYLYPITLTSAIYDLNGTDLDTLLANKAASSHTHSYAGSSSAGGSATTAVKLATARTLTIGSTGKTFDGSANVSWTLAEIGAAATDHGTHVTFSTTAPVVAGTAAVGTATTVSRSDHVHPAQTSVSGNAGTATKLATARTLTIGSTGKSFDGSANVSWTLSEIGALALDGSTSMTGVIVAAANMYDDTGTSGALNMSNSNIIGVNAIYMSEDASSANEGINFYNSEGLLDSLWANGGKLYFTAARGYASDPTGTKYTIANLEYNKLETQANLVIDTSSYSVGNTDTDLSTWKETNGKIVLRPENGGAHDIYVIPTQHDNVKSKAGIVIGGPQGGEYLWTMGDMVTNGAFIFNRQYDTTGAPKDAGAISGDTVMSYSFNPAGKITTSPIITVYAPADVNGICTVIGGGGATIIAAGEAYSSFPGTAMVEESLAYGTETVYIAADGQVGVYTNCNKIASRVMTAQFTGKNTNLINARAQSFFQYDSAKALYYSGGLARIDSSSPSCKTANLMLWAY